MLASGTSRGLASPRGLVHEARTVLHAWVGTRRPGRKSLSLLHLSTCVDPALPSFPQKFHASLARNQAHGNKALTGVEGGIEKEGIWPTPRKCGAGVASFYGNSRLAALYAAMAHLDGTDETKLILYQAPKIVGDALELLSVGKGRYFISHPVRKVDGSRPAVDGGRWEHTVIDLARYLPKRRGR